jgi:hypothetical protein
LRRWFVTAERTEAVAERALLTGACRHKSIESILRNPLDRQPLEAQQQDPAASELSFAERLAMLMDQHWN